MVRSQCCHPLAGPAVATACGQSVPVEDAGKEIIIGDEDQLPNGGDEIGRCAFALTAPASRQAQFGANAPDPVDDEDDLSRMTVRTMRFAFVGRGGACT